MLCFVQCILQQRSVNSVHPSSSSLTQDGAHSRLPWSCDIATFSVTWRSYLLHFYHLFTILHLFHHFIILTPILVYRHASHLSRLYPFLLGSPARCAFLSYLCLYTCLGSPARSRLSRSHSCPNRSIYGFGAMAVPNTCLHNPFDPIALSILGQ